MIDLAVSSFNRWERKREREFDEMQKKAGAIVKSNESGNWSVIVKILRGRGNMTDALVLARTIKLVERMNG